jgi:hypothetical protein
VCLEGSLEEAKAGLRDGVCGSKPLPLPLGSGKCIEDLNSVTPESDEKLGSF